MAAQNYNGIFPGPTTKFERPLFNPSRFPTVYSQSSSQSRPIEAALRLIEEKVSAKRKQFEAQR